MTYGKLAAVLSLGLAAALTIHCGDGADGQVSRDDASAGQGGAQAGQSGTGGAGAGGTVMDAGGTVAGAGGTVADAGGQGRDAASSSPDAPASSGDAPLACSAQLPKLKLTKVAEASAPLLLVQPKGDPRMYVVERGGTIRFLRDGKLETTPFFTLDPKPPQDGERGLLGLAFHPQFVQNGRFFVYFNRGDGDLVIAEAKRSQATADRADSTLTPLVTIEHSMYSNHNGGMLAFGPDGMLYAGTGDGGAGGDPFTTGQNTKAKLGKMLRFDVDKPNERPAGNMPDPADIHVWAYGLRNPWRWSFDMQTGDMYIGDVGQDRYEEVDFIPAGSKAGLNLGWSQVEGLHCYRANCAMTGTLLPIVEYDQPSDAPADSRSVTGGFVYRGARIPCLRGRYIYADFVTNQIFSLVVEAGKATRQVELTADLREGNVRTRGIPGFGQDADGEVYVLSLEDGAVYRIDAE